MDSQTCDVFEQARSLVSMSSLCSVDESWSKQLVQCCNQQVCFLKSSLATFVSYQCNFMFQLLKVFGCWTVMWATTSRRRPWAWTRSTSTSIPRAGDPTTTAKWSMVLPNSPRKRSYKASWRFVVASANFHCCWRLIVLSSLKTGSQSRENHCAHWIQLWHLCCCSPVCVHRNHSEFLLFWWFWLLWLKSAHSVFRKKCR